MKKVIVFNWMWYRVVRYLVPVKSAKYQMIDRYYWRMRVQWALARIFGGAKGVIAGDSNGAVQDNYKTMSKYGQIVLNWAVPGTTAHSWYEFLTASHGKKIRILMYSVKQIFNLGGNYILLGMIDSAREGLKWIRTWFPDSYNCTIPPIMGDVLSEGCKLAGVKGERTSPLYYLDGIIKVNKLIREFWGLKCIDLYMISVDAHGNPKPLLLRDMVHFSEFSVNIIQKIFDAVV